MGNDDAVCDEIVLFGKNNFKHIIIGKDMTMQKTTVSVRSLNGKGEKSFGCATFVNEEYYAVGSQSGNIYLCQSNKAKKMYPSHSKSIGDLYWMNNAKKLVSVGYDDKIIHWTLNENKLEKESEIETEKEIKLDPRCLTMNEETNEIFVGTKNNQILMLKDNKTECILDGHDGEVWGLCTHPNQPEIYATGSYDQCIKVWNAKTKKCVQTEQLPLIQSKKKKKKKRKNRNYICCGCWSQDGKLLAFGTMDSYIYLFKYNEEETDQENKKYIELQFSTNSGEHEVIKTFTRDYEIVHWILNRQNKDCKFCPWIPDPNELTFYDDPLIAGYDVKGCYLSNKGWDGTDLNDIALTKDKKLVISGDDYGTIRVYNYPAIEQKPYKSYTQHAEFVVAVKLLSDDSELISCGGADRAIFEWKLNKLCP